MKEDNDFYKPFTELKRFLEKNSIYLANSSLINENISFSEAMKGVRAIDRSNTRVVMRQNIKRSTRNNMEEPKSQLEKALDESYTFNVTNLPEYMEGYAEHVSPLTMEKLRNGEFSIQKTLDLHGHNKTEAQKLFEDFIKDAVRLQLNCVKVIHGRGLKSPGTPVLKKSLTKWIIRAMNRKWILAFASCRMCDGGPGATYILLKKKPEKEKISFIG